MKTIRLAVAGLCAALVAGPAFASTDVVLEWNEVMVAVVGEHPAPNASRVARYYAARRLRSDRCRDGGLPVVSWQINPSSEASAEAAQSLPRMVFSPLDSRARGRAGRGTGPLTRPNSGRTCQSRRISIGETAAARAIAARATDGSEPPEFYLPSSSNAGDWQLTAGCPPTGGLFLHWRNAAPFALRRADRFRSEPPPPLAGSRYARDLPGGPGGRWPWAAAERPPGSGERREGLRGGRAARPLWNPIARQLAAARRRSLADNAPVRSRCSTWPMSDALVAVMDTKYHYTFWRPETAIAGGAIDGNDRTDPDASFVPLISVRRVCRLDSSSR